ncbi:MAG TPA: FAD binding domain-containing protein [Steroidobacteraceae bacterium]|nr:FAD binding domain-containing protein [Steroidobacteraceae bacterium]
MNRFSWLSARSVAEAAAAASATVAAAMARPGGAERADGAMVKAGGIDVLDLLKEGLFAPATLVSLTGLPGLDEVAEEAGAGIRIGSMVTLAKIAGHPLIRERHPALADAAARSASPQIRNVATLGGNLLQRPRCWYFRSKEYRCLRKGGEHCYAHAGDNRYHAIFDNRPCAIVHPSSAATVLVALGAMVELVTADAHSRRMSLEKFLRPPEDVTRENDLRAHEILTQIHLPRLGPGVRTAYLRVGEKQAFDWPLADVAAALELEPDGRCRSAAIVLGAAAPAPHRALLAERALTGRTIDEGAVNAAARAAIEGATPLANNAYKLPLVETLVRRAILAAGKSQAP